MTTNHTNQVRVTVPITVRNSPVSRFNRLPGPRTPFGRAVILLAMIVTVLAGADDLRANEALQPVGGIAMHGVPELPDGFAHFPYADPAAPKGGTITYGIQGSFDSVNPFILRGQKVSGLRDAFYGNNVFESLMIRSHDEPFAMYGLIAENVIMPTDRSFIEFILNPKARFSDGMPVTPEDVIFSAEILAKKGRPNYQKYYSRIRSMEKTGENRVRVTFNGEPDRELPLLLSLLPILPKHAINAETFDQTTLTPIIGTGPYLLTKVDQGSGITLTRDPNYWAKDLPVKRGLDNFDEIRFVYYRESKTLFEAFKKGLVDVYFDSDPNNWSAAYEGRALNEGRIIQSTFETGLSSGVRGYAFNTRRAPLSDIRVRKALSMMFDFKWMNENLFSGGYERTGSFFQNSELSALGVAASGNERALLRPFMAEIDPEVLEGRYQPSKTDGSGRDRAMLRAALTELQSAGYRLKDRVLVDQTGKPLALELLMASGDDQERVALSYSQTLAALGIQLTVRPVDAAQFEERRKTFDFDMLSWNWAGSLSPGNEQYFRWSSPFADQPGSFNFSGVKSKGVDAMIDAMLAAVEKSDYVDAVRALDRLLMSGRYVLPHYHMPRQLVGHSARIGMPQTVSLYGTRPETWWIKEVVQ